MANVNDTTSAIVRLIRERRENPGLLQARVSVRAAARRANALGGEFSEPTWRRIESGTRDIDDREIVFMVAAINDLADSPVISPEEIEQAGRPSAAELYRALIRERAKTDPALAHLDADVTPSVLLQKLQGMLAEIRGLRGVSAEQKAQMEQSLMLQVDALLDAVSAQLHILRPR
ncbi:hypothetical protein GCM10023194_81180 [Planotetraspora phitsanulokensis]|uniref:Uncharacterized protein n=1 Tax=Planotetraspora phitsanulokensis TaxID=575192 RepID=A0A8J3UE56_9ACTN|nr:hypothetical protein [Planotetraspora phitsanulokensis]GII42851.1 hypothetical protein Pph01_78540 [Planotetraspora phitsanulokensis]